MENKEYSFADYLLNPDLMAEAIANDPDSGFIAAIAEDEEFKVMVTTQNDYLIVMTDWKRVHPDFGTSVFEFPIEGFNMEKRQQVADAVLDQLQRFLVNIDWEGILSPLNGGVWYPPLERKQRD